MTFFPGARIIPFQMAKDARLKEIKKAIIQYVKY